MLSISNLLTILLYSILPLIYKANKLFDKYSTKCNITVYNLDSISYTNTYTCSISLFSNESIFYDNNIIITESIDLCSITNHTLINNNNNNDNNLLTSSNINNKNKANNKYGIMVKRGGCTFTEKTNNAILLNYDLLM